MTWYVCIYDRWSGELLSADPCSSIEEAWQFIRNELNLWPTEDARIITESEYKAWKRRECAHV